MDFGLAKLAEATAGNDSTAPTRLKLDTEPGVIMGTVSYMSPEQARGWLSMQGQTSGAWAW
ncbi:MAG TPA: hypothetical protein VKF81_04780 [Blastocatellia bacterium]|nr:hypothetical protein [Blastocatellia bacterium]